ncbi:MAG: hypothetical protein Q4E45_12335 [Eubacteriales bacterium]|nr:hypothetical protein [Eubacteriales bacterium]
MNNTMNAIASIFTGKGGTIKLAIFGSLIAAVIYEIMDSSYGLNVTTKEGSVSLAPASGASGQQMQTDSAHEDEPEQDQMPTAVTDVQVEDEPEG